MAEYFEVRKKKATPQLKKPLGMRKNWRFPVNTLNINLRKTGVLALFKNISKQVSLINLSRNGVQLLLTETLKTNANYKIDLHIARFIDPISVKARVVWCHPYKRVFDKTYYRVGFEFVRLNREIENNLVQLEASA
ncbi:MAG: PilZ domain-containing protein [Thermodesulfobacteriota bacterium]|nr:PilZ domain-containing protein [Thermodesulfobacteriota bacterium]